MQKRAKTSITSRRGTRPASRTRAVRPSTARARRATKPAARRRRRSASATARGRTTKAPGRISARTTTDRDAIIRWAEARGGHPATVIRTANKWEPGVLRIDFPGFTGEGTLMPISWDDWFRKFEERKLAFLHQNRAPNGKLSRFFKLIKRPSRA